jgi:hypothetical protein
MSNDWGKPITPEELAKISGAQQATTVWPDHQQVAKPTQSQLSRALETIMSPDFGKTVVHEHRAELVPQIIDGSVVAVDAVAEEPAKYERSDTWPYAKRIDPTPATIDSTPEELAAKGWVQTAHDEWEKIAPDTSPFAGAKVTLTYIDEAHIEPGGDWSGVSAAAWPEPTADNWPGPMGEAVKAAVAAEVEEVRTAAVDTYSETDGPWYVVYFGTVLYTVLAGPYETEEAAAERIDIVWGQFEHDAAYDFTFPVRERSGLRASTVRTVYNLKGAYGKQ